MIHRKALYCTSSPKEFPQHYQMAILLCNSLDMQTPSDAVGDNSIQESSCRNNDINVGTM